MLQKQTNTTSSAFIKNTNTKQTLLRYEHEHEHFDGTKNVFSSVNFHQEGNENKAWNRHILCFFVYISQTPVFLDSCELEKQ